MSNEYCPLPLEGISVTVPSVPFSQVAGVEVAVSFTVSGAADTGTTIVAAVAQPAASETAYV
jgi:hypothetical protein